MKPLSFWSFLFRLGRVERALVEGTVPSRWLAVGVAVFLLDMLVDNLLPEEQATAPSLAQVFVWIEIGTIVAGVVACTLAGGAARARAAWSTIPVLWVPILVRIVVVGVVTYLVLLFGLGALLVGRIPASTMVLLFSTERISVFDLVFFELLLAAQLILVFRAVRRVVEGPPAEGNHG